MLQFLLLSDKDVLEVKKQQTKPLAINLKKKKIKMHENKIRIILYIKFCSSWIVLVLFNLF